MRKCILIRQPSDEQGTLGRIYVDKINSFFTLELPWLENEARISCIPAGNYTVRWTLSPRLKKFTYEITKVPERGGIRIHGGNFAGSVPDYISHSLGCPLLGINYGKMNGQKAVFASKMAVLKFEKLMNKEDFELEIKWAEEPAN